MKIYRQKKFSDIDWRKVAEDIEVAGGVTKLYNHCSKIKTESRVQY